MEFLVLIGIFLVIGIIGWLIELIKRISEKIAYQKALSEYNQTIESAFHGLKDFNVEPTDSFIQEVNNDIIKAWNYKHPITYNDIDREVKKVGEKHIKGRQDELL